MATRSEWRGWLIRVGQRLIGMAMLGVGAAFMLAPDAGWMTRAAFGIVFGLGIEQSIHAGRTWTKGHRR